jgi:hypothetical protein
MRLYFLGRVLFQHFGCKIDTFFKFLRQFVQLDKFANFFFVRDFPCHSLQFVMVSKATLPSGPYDKGIHGLSKVLTGPDPFTTLFSFTRCEQATPYHGVHKKRNALTKIVTAELPVNEILKKLMTSI